MNDRITLAEPTRALAAYASRLAYRDLPREVVAKSRLCALDAIGCMLHGSTLPWTRIVRDVALEQGGAPQAVVIGTPHRTAVTQAVLVNSTAGHGFELDDAHTRASMHVGSMTVSSALAIGEWKGRIDGRDFVTALVAGYEAGLRIGAAGAGNIFKRGFHSAAVCGVFAAAATAGRLIGLDAGQMQHAFGIAGSLASGLMAAQEGAMVKRLHSGRAAQTGVYAALLASRGFTGIPNVLEAPFGGFFSAMTDQCQPEALTAGLGRTWETLAVGFKPYATAGAIHASLQGLDDIMGRTRLTADDIAEISVRCTSYCQRHVAWPYRPQGVASAQLNIYYALAVMALDRDAMIEQFREERLGDPRILDFIPRIRVDSDPRFDAMGNDYRYAVSLTLRTRNGESLAFETLHRPGTRENPVSEARLKSKFALLAGCALPGDRVQAVLEMVNELEQLDDSRRLSQLLAVPA
ncbi:MAG: MmgE/PrpD family protein [Betaproteobacteria bacterium]|nr:MmgE/PrpD family protein [Betaproteobacteria bacterium]